MKEFFEHLTRLTKPKRPDLIEKDYHLHRLLRRISLSDYLRENLVFKGGTCLVKAYTDRYRFSEDLDFTWKDQTKWEGKNPSQVRKECSKEINTILEHLVGIAEELDLDFKGDKSSIEQVIIGGGGRMPRFYLKYNSEILKVPVKIKVEINFIDLHLYPYKMKKLGTYLTTIESEETSFLYKDQWIEYSQSINIDCLDPREIFTEKARAALTRIKYKLRDIIDIYMLQQQYGYTIPEYKEPILEKTRYILDLYQKYREVVETKILPEAEDIQPEELLLLTIEPPNDLEVIIQRIHGEIEDIKKEL